MGESHHLCPDFAFAIVFDPICSLNLNLLQVKGRSDIFLRLEIIKKIIAIAILFAAIPLGVVAICISKVIYTQVAVYLNTYYTGKLINVGFIRQMRDITPTLLYSLSMGAVVWAVIQPVPGEALKLLAGIAVGVAYYVLVTKITGSRDLRELVAFVRSR